jgi:hypothetical protein
MPDARQVLLAGGNAETLLAQSVEVLADVFGSDPREFESPLLAPGKKPIDGAPVGGPGVLIANAAIEKLLGGEDGRLASALNDIRQGGCLGFGSKNQSVRGVGWGSQGRVSFYA